MEVLTQLESSRIKEIKPSRHENDGLSIPSFEQKALVSEKTDNQNGDISLSPLKHDVPEFTKKELNSNDTNDVVKNDKSETFEDKKDGEPLSSYDERLKNTPLEGERGHWEGERGESTYIPAEGSEIKDILDKHEQDGVNYKDGIPDFSPFSESTVEIDNMTDRRLGKDGNFDQADQKCAEQWNNEGRDGKVDWTKEDVQQWREDNGYSWHECNDRKTCQLIPTEVNDYFGHLGGVAECKKANQEGSKFDE